MVETVPPEVLAAGDGSAMPLSFESAQLNSPAPITGASGEPLPTSLSGVEREYIWGPGDNGLDEILVQYDIERKAFWMMACLFTTAAAMSVNIKSCAISPAPAAQPE